jgi:hypothetical protein
MCFLSLVGLYSCGDEIKKPSNKIDKNVPVKNKINQKIKGACLEMPKDPINDNDFVGIEKMNIGWIAVIPYGFTRNGKSKVEYNYNFQWWGESKEGVIETIKMAHKKDIKVMLKPHVWVSGQGWAGEFSCETEQEWKIWENSYRDYILKFAHIADSMNVDLFCIGTEYRIAATQRPKFWKALIDTVKTVYGNALTYAANWDNYKKISFWDQLDYIGIDAYFPVTSSRKPTKEKIKIAYYCNCTLPGQKLRPRLPLE